MMSSETGLLSSTKLKFRNTYFIYLYTIDVNECATNPCSCAPGSPGCISTCHNTIGSYQCRCNSGFKLVGGKVCTGMYNEFYHIFTMWLGTLVAVLISVKTIWTVCFSDSQCSFSLFFNPAAI